MILLAELRHVYKSRVIERLRKLFSSTPLITSPPADCMSSKVFCLTAEYEVVSLRELLGEKTFAGLRTLDRAIPSPGEIILSETHGLRLATIAANLKRFGTRLDNEIGSFIEVRRDEYLLSLWHFILRLDDLADVGRRQDDDVEAQAIVTNLLEFHLSLINELQKQLESAAIELLVKRFSAREALRGTNLRPYVAIPDLHLT